MDWNQRDRIGKITRSLTLLNHLIHCSFYSIHLLILSRRFSEYFRSSFRIRILRANQRHCHASEPSLERQNCAQGIFRTQLSAKIPEDTFTVAYRHTAGGRRNKGEEKSPPRGSCDCRFVNNNIVLLSWPAHHIQPSTLFCGRLDSYRGKRFLLISVDCIHAVATVLVEL